MKLTTERNELERNIWDYSSGCSEILNSASILTSTAHDVSVQATGQS